MVEPPESRGQRLLLALTALLLPIVAIPYLQLPFAGEHGIYAFGAWRMSQGEVPYRDFWNMNTPAVFLVHRAADALFGHAMRSIRLLDLLWTLATLWFLHRVSRRAFGEPAASLAVLLATVTYFTLGHQPTAQRDGWCLLPLLAMLDGAARSSPSARGDRRLAFGIGLGSALAFWLKPPFLLPSAVCAVVFLRRRPRPHGVLIALGAAQFLVVTLAVLLYFWWHGALRDLYENTVLFNSEYTRERYSLAEQARIFGRLALAGPMWLVGTVACLVALGRAPARPFIALIAACVVVVVVQGKLYGYHLAPLRLLLCATTAALVASLWDARTARVASRAAVVGIMALAIGSSVQAFRIQQYPQIWQLLFRGGAVTVRREEVSLAEMLAARTQPQDTILVWGEGTPGIVHYLAERRSPTRFTLSYPFSMQHADSPLVARWRREFIEALRRAPPRMVVVVGGDAWEELKNVDSAASFERFTELRDFVAENYRPVARLPGRRGEYQVFVRNGPAQPPAPD